MADVTHVKIGDIEAIEGFFEGIKFHKAAAGLGGQMFAKRPGQLGQEEVYIALRGSGIVEADGEEYPLDSEHVVRLGPAVKRKITPGSDGLRLLALGGVPGEAYDTGSRL